jgi:hypothetical protein
MMVTKSEKVHKMDKSIDVATNRQSTIFDHPLAHHQNGPLHGLHAK